MDLRKRLASQSVIIFLGRIFGAGLIFLAQAAMARVWGQHALGEYLLFIAAVNLIAAAMPLGFQTIGTYFAAEYRAKGQGCHLRRFLLRSYVQTLIVGGVLLVFGKPLTAALGETGTILSAMWVPAIILAAATAFIFINGAVLVGMKRPYSGYFAEGIFRPMLLLGCFALALFYLEPEARLSGMIWYFAIGYSVIALVHLGLTLKVVWTVSAHEIVDDKMVQGRRWWRFAAPWVLISLATDYFFDLDLIFLAAFMTPGDLAIFGVCARIFALVSFGVAAVYAVTLPDIFESEALDDREGFTQKVGDANLVAFGLAFVLFAGMSIGAPVALMLFGTDFLAGSGPLATLCLGLVVRSIFGPASLVLSIHDRPWASLPAIGCGVLALLIGNVVLVPLLGLMGAATAALIGITVWSGGMWLTARHLVGVDVSAFPRILSFLRQREAAKA